MATAGSGSPLEQAQGGEQRGDGPAGQDGQVVPGQRQRGAGGVQRAGDGVEGRLAGQVAEQGGQPARPAAECPEHARQHHHREVAERQHRLGGVGRGNDGGDGGADAGPRERPEGEGHEQAQGRTGAQPGVVGQRARRHGHRPRGERHQHGRAGAAGEVAPAGERGRAPALEHTGLAGGDQAAGVGEVGGEGDPEHDPAGQCRDREVGVLGAGEHLQQERQRHPGHQGAGIAHGQQQLVADLTRQDRSAAGKPAWAGGRDELRHGTGPPVPLRDRRVAG
jgi:hypothetical protein